MFTLDSEDALLKAFRPKDRRWVEPPPGVSLPVTVPHVLSWVHPAGGYRYLVFCTPGGVPTGVVFDTNGGGGAAIPAMCDWCHHTGVGTEVGLLTAQLNGKKRVGVYLCSDLSCDLKVEDEANRAGRDPAPELARLIDRMGRFASEALKIDLSGAGR